MTLRKTEKYEKILKLREQGKTFREIREILKISRQRAQQVYSFLEGRKKRRPTKIERAILYLADMLEDPNHDAYNVKKTTLELLELEEVKVTVI